MSGSTQQPRDPVSCADCQPLFQDYLDGTLPKPKSLELFLHVRECADCQTALEELKQVFQLLESLPEREVPADFNTPVLSSVPYAHYREMATLRQDRVPVFLEEEFLPRPVRSVATRAVGLAVAAGAAFGLAVSWLPDPYVLAVVAGVLPETLVRTQRLARRWTLAGQRSESS
jgi:hypothetical protein